MGLRRFLLVSAVLGFLPSLARAQAVAFHDLFTSSGVVYGVPCSTTSTPTTLHTKTVNILPLTGSINDKSFSAQVINITTDTVDVGFDVKMSTGMPLYGWGASTQPASIPLYGQGASYQIQSAPLAVNLYCRSRGAAASEVVLIMGE